MRTNIHKLSTAVIALIMVVVGGSTVMALPEQARAHAKDASAAATGTSQAVIHQQEAKTKLTAAKLKSCQNRQQAIQNIMSRIADRGQKQLTLFTGIATKVENFYTTKGKPLSNYDTLLADVNAKQAAAQSTVDSIKSDSTGFSCDSSDPTGFVNSFKTALKSEILALQDYRTSVKNLIVGVKSVQAINADNGNTTGDTSND